MSILTAAPSVITVQPITHADFRPVKHLLLRHGATPLNTEEFHAYVCCRAPGFTARRGPQLVGVLMAQTKMMLNWQTPRDVDEFEVFKFAADLLGNFKSFKLN